MPLEHTDLEGTLTIGGIPMQNSFGAWGICGDARGRGGLLHLWNGFKVRGQDRLLPSVTGVLAYQRRITVTPHDLRLLIVGDVNGQTGAVATDPIETLADNFSYLLTNVVAPVASSTGTRAASLSVPGQSARTADIHVETLDIDEYQLGMCGAIAVCKLHISIPEGRFS